LGSGPDALAALQQLEPRFHPDPERVVGALENQFTDGARAVDGAGGASYAIGGGVLRYLADLSPSNGTSIESGCGYSTVVLAAVFATHICVNPDLASNGLVREFVDRHLGTTGLRHVEASSDRGLPTLVAEGCRAELALIDGNHSHPFPLLDFHYMDQMLAPGGLLLVDNTEIPAVQELTDYLDADGAYQVDRQIGNCAVYRKVRDRQFGWKSQTIRRDTTGVDAVRQELTRLRMEVAPELRASLGGGGPLPAAVAFEESRQPHPDSHGVPPPPIRPGLEQLLRWYATPSGALAGVGLLLLAVGVAAPWPWRLMAVAGVVLLAAFFPYRFLREQQRTDRRLAELNTRRSRRE
jgi:hypothetical protein